MILPVVGIAAVTLLLAGYRADTGADPAPRDEVGGVRRRGTYPARSRHGVPGPVGAPHDATGVSG